MAQDPVQFVRQGLSVSVPGDVSIRDAAGNAIDIDDSVTLDEGSSQRQILFFDWQPRAEYRITVDRKAEQAMRAPAAPSPYLVRTIPLEDASASAGAGMGAATGTPPDSVVRFSPDNRLLAIGTLAGHLRVVDIFTGKLLHHQRISEGQIKQLAWSPDGRQLYVGEQSPDANLFALALPSEHGNAKAFRRIWTLRLADQLESSRLPPGDRYGVYSLPAVHDLAVSDDGRLFVVGLHSWSVGGTPRVRSMLYSVSADGKTLWQFPGERAAELSITHAAIDAAGTKLVFLANPPISPEAEPRVRGNTFYQLDGLSGEVVYRYSPNPLEPHFQRLEAWDSVAVSPRGDRFGLGLADGRALLFLPQAGRPPRVETFELGTPVLVGGLPVAAACSYTRAFGDTIYFETQNSHVPFGSPQAAHQAPAPHRGANMLTALGLEGSVRWRYRGPFALSGVWCNRAEGEADPRWLMVTCRELPGAGEPGQFGFLLFDLARPGGGSDKLVYYYATEGPVIFNADISADGRWIAVTEVPAPTPDGFDLYGTHQVHIVH
ncbi:MAG: hypothetical protein KF708_10535 [Pirellulales bacterium]|nr:hypothetical protein [Pirellulales bacterium]